MFFSGKIISQKQTNNKKTLFESKLPVCTGNFFEDKFLFAFLFEEELKSASHKTWNRDRIDLF